VLYGHKVISLPEIVVIVTTSYAPPALLDHAALKNLKSRYSTLDNRAYVDRSGEDRSGEDAHSLQPHPASTSENHPLEESHAVLCAPVVSTGRSVPLLDHALNRHADVVAAPHQKHPPARAGADDRD
jgi:hypothetical protein